MPFYNLRRISSNDDEPSCFSPVKSPFKTPRSRTQVRTPYCSLKDLAITNDEVLLRKSPLKTPRSSITVTPPDCSLKDLEITNDEVLLRKSPLKTPRSSKTDLEAISPPKRKRVAKKIIPETPKTPSENLENLSELQTPVRNNILTPSPTKSPVKTDQRDQKLSNCKKILGSLHESAISIPVGRDKELKIIENFIKNHALKGLSGSLYVTGPPGTGKTACVSFCIHKFTFENSKSNKINAISINCMTLKSSRDIYKKICDELSIKIDAKHKTKSKLPSFLKQHFTQRGSPILIVLDEMDHLGTHSQDVLSNIFQWSSLLNSRLNLIGVANALEPLDSTLPYLNSVSDCKVELLQFYPYSKQEIRRIIESRLEDFKEDSEAIFKPVVIEYCSRSAAAHNGDVRKALSMLRQAVTNTIKKSTKNDVINDRIIKTPTKSKPDFEVKLQDVQHVLNSVSNSVSNVNGHQLPLQQKIVILCFMSRIKNSKIKEITIGKLHDIYSSLCRKQGLTCVDTSDLVSICSQLEDQGIFKLKRNKEARMMKVGLRVAEMDLEPLLQQEKHLVAMLDEKKGSRD